MRSCVIHQVVGWPTAILVARKPIHGKNLQVRRQIQISRNQHCYYVYDISESTGSQPRLVHMPNQTVPTNIPSTICSHPKIH